MTHHFPALVRDIDNLVELTLCIDKLLSGTSSASVGCVTSRKSETVSQSCFKNLLLCSGNSQICGHLFQFSDNTEIGQDVDELAVMTAFHLRGSFCSGLSQLTRQSHHIYFFAFCSFFSGLGIAFGFGKVCPLSP